MKITLVRHGKTQSNQEHRYLGWTDELLCREGIALLLKKMRKGLYPQSPDRWCAAPCGAASRRRHGSARRAILIG